MSLLQKAGCDLKHAGEHGRTPAYAAACNGHESCLSLLQEAGCDLGQTDNDGKTPAQLAAANGHESCLRLLKEAGCDLEQQDNIGLTPAYMAAANGHESCLRLIQDSAITNTTNSTQPVLQKIECSPEQASQIMQVMQQSEMDTSNCNIKIVLN